MVRKSRKSRSHPKRSSPGATQEEEDQLAELAAGHPWSLTVQEFLSLVEARYGAKLHELVTRDAAGREVVHRYLQSDDKETIVHLPAGISMEDQLTEVTTRSLCRRLRIPPEDFGLAPDDPDEIFEN
jgi:hypothetical protein